MSHTPGPWTLADTSYMAEGVKYVLAGTNEHGWEPEIAVIYSGDNQEANARLIAASPDLLAESKAVVAWFDRLKHYQHEQLVLGQTLESASRNWQTMTQEPLDLTPLIAAIANAEGAK